MARVRAVKLEEPTPQQLFDLCMLGLAWLRQDAPDVLDRLGNSVLVTMRTAGTHSRTVQDRVLTNYGLVKLAEAFGQDVMTDVRPPKHDLDELVRTSERLFLYLRYPKALLNHTWLFGPGGYPLVITDAGLAYAAERAVEYAYVITRDDFIDKWRQHVRNVRAMHRDR